ncbi:hypothetical protein BN938_1046 [Mucinivorans hirudinis]|uniref:Plasmid pRiA4b Orf3-like domain-containing protein n=1 Tax=Mucinivorans hirudinis TaxID=1433126 RepID=A0A060RBH3_9BACT|nr:hypothetical protein BN938_1046 [Mucinivorans hirudinis]
MLKYRIKISLDGAKPPIWRRVIVPADILLPDLHRVIQGAMGWEDEHLHHFEKNRVFYEPAEDMDETDAPLFFGEASSEDYSEVTLRSLIYLVKDKLSYCYDFGDNWDHTILIEEIIDNDQDDDPTPICIKGKGACPPENCGGLWGYYAMLEALEDTKHPDHKGLRDWMGLKRGEVYDPAYFDIDEVNRFLRGEYDEVEQREFAITEKILKLDNSQLSEISEIMVLESEAKAREYYMDIIEKRIQENELSERRAEFVEGANYLLELLFNNIKTFAAVAGAAAAKAEKNSAPKGIVVDFPKKK